MSYSGLRTLAAAITLLAVLRNGMAVPDRIPPACNELMVMSGNSFQGDSTFCQVYYQCDGTKQYAMICPRRTLWDNSANACTYTEKANCVNWPCNNNTVGQKFHSLCSDYYYDCTLTGFKEMTCPAGEIFDLATQGCVAGTGKDDDLCKRYDSNTTTQPEECYNVPADNPCQYKSKIMDGTYKLMDCPQTLAFNATSCLCSIHNDSCSSGATPSNKLHDARCRPSFRVDFTYFDSETGDLKAVSDKLGDQPTLLPDAIAHVGVHFENDAATLSSDDITNEEAHFYVYSYNNNELTADNLFCITYKTSEQKNVTLFSNDFKGICNATFKVSATYDGTQYHVKAFAVGQTQINKRMKAFRDETINGSITIPAGNFIGVCVSFAGILGMHLSDHGTDGETHGEWQHIYGTKSLGTTIATNKCGLLVAEGLNGVVYEFAGHEGCKNITKGLEGPTVLVR